MIALFCASLTKGLKVSDLCEKETVLCLLPDDVTETTYTGPKLVPLLIVLMRLPWEYVQVSVEKMWACCLPIHGSQKKGGKNGRRQNKQIPNLLLILVSDIKSLVLSWELKYKLLWFLLSAHNEPCTVALVVTLSGRPCLPGCPNLDTACLIYNFIPGVFFCSIAHVLRVCTFYCLPMWVQEEKTWKFSVKHLVWQPCFLPETETQM